MGFLDVTIVNIAFPDIRASFRGTSLAGLSWILNAYNIVFAALLVPAGRLADRVGRRRMFFVGLLDVPRRLGRRAGSRRRSRCSSRARVVQAAGAAAARADLARAAAARVPARAARDRDRRSGARPAPSRRPPGRRSAARSSTWTGWRLGVLRQPRDRPARPDPGAPRCCARRASPNRARCPTPSASRCSSPGSALLSLGIVKGQDWGWGSDARRRVARRGRRRARRCFVVRSARHPAPVIEPALFRVRSFAVSNAGDVRSSRSASTRSCSPTSCSSPARGTTRC